MALYVKCPAWESCVDRNRESDGTVAMEGVTNCLLCRSSKTAVFSASDPGRERPCLIYGRSREKGRAKGEHCIRCRPPALADFQHDSPVIGLVIGLACRR